MDLMVYWNMGLMPYWITGASFSIGTIIGLILGLYGSDYFKKDDNKK